MPDLKYLPTLLWFTATNETFFSDMKNKIYSTITENRTACKKMLAVLLDPDKCKEEQRKTILAELKAHVPTFVFVGGSHTMQSTDEFIQLIREKVSVPVIQFPGNASQFSEKADALLYLSLLSGRNAEFLIGQHVYSAMAVKNSGVEVIPTAYILIDGGKNTSVQYMSNTSPIPSDKIDITVSTAVAGELLGLKMAYLEAGSGALNPVSAAMIKAVRDNLKIPLIVGGGISTTESLKAAFDAGADLVVVGNAFESDNKKIERFVKFTENYNR